MIVQQLEVYVPGWGWTIHVKVQREDGKSGISWDQLQKIKTIVAGENARAIEIYPRDKDIVNDLNMRHLWIVPENIALPNLNWDLTGNE